MNKFVKFGLFAAAVAGTAAAIALWKRSQDEAALRYDSDDFDDDEDCCAEEDCNACGVCDENLDVDVPADEVKEAVKDAAEDVKDTVTDAAEDIADAVKDAVDQAEDAE